MANWGMFNQGKCCREALFCDDASSGWLWFYENVREIQLTMENYTPGNCASQTLSAILTPKGTDLDQPPFYWQTGGCPGEITRAEIPSQFCEVKPDQPASFNLMRRIIGFNMQCADIPDHWTASIFIEAWALASPFGFTLGYADMFALNPTPKRNTEIWDEHIFTYSQNLATSVGGGVCPSIRFPDSRLRVRFIPK